MVAVGGSHVGGAINVDVHELYALANTMGAQAEAIIREENKHAMGRSVVIAQNEVKQRMPVRTGKMRREWLITIAVNGRTIIGEAASTAKNKAGQAYAIFVELGHHIVAWGHPTGRFSIGRGMFLYGTAAAEPKVQAEFDAAATRAAQRIERLR